MKELEIDESGAKPVSHICIILDKSYSMLSMKDEAIKLFNEQVKSIKKGAKENDIITKVSLVTFNNDVDEPLYFNKPVSKMTQMKPEDYSPNGGTALLDAVGTTLSRLEKSKSVSGKNSTFLVIIISDGEENSSKYYSSSKIEKAENVNNVYVAGIAIPAFPVSPNSSSAKNENEPIGEMVERLQGTGRWTFTFLGADVDLKNIQSALHIPKGNIRGWDKSAKGLGAVSTLSSIGTQSYMASAARGIGNRESLYDDIKTEFRASVDSDTANLIHEVEDDE